MCDTTRAERLLALFTSSDGAAAIAGDLTEERGSSDSARFWLNVWGTALALWRSSLTDAPLVVLMLAGLGCTFLIAPAFGGAVAFYLFPRSSGSTVSWIALALFWWGGALLTGAFLVSIAPRRGMAACATLAIAGAALLMAWVVGTLWDGPLTADFILFNLIILTGAALLLVGSAVARWRIVAGETKRNYV